jgi:negative regulator of sigma E activity
MNRRLHPDDPSRLDEVIAQRLRTTAPSAAPQHVLEEALARISQTPQQRGTWLSSRAPRLLAVAAVIALAAVVGLQLPAMLNSIGTDPTPEPSPSFNATPTSTPALTPAGSASVEPSPSPSPAIQTPSAEPAPTADAQSNETSAMDASSGRG